MKEHMNEEQARALLKKYSTTKHAYEKVLAHAQAVKRYALALAQHIECDSAFVATAALLHDIGRFQCPPPDKKNAVWHGVVGARILRKENWRLHARCCERHVGAGITKTEAARLGLPAKPYIPLTIEEKIVCYADSCIKGTRRMTNSYAVERYRKEVSEIVARRQQRLHNFLIRRMKK